MGIQNRYEERLVSRLFTLYEPMHFIGEDVRLLKKTASKPMV